MSGRLVHRLPEPGGWRGQADRLEIAGQPARPALDEVLEQRQRDGRDHEHDGYVQVEARLTAGIIAGPRAWGLAFGRLHWLDDKPAATGLQQAPQETLSPMTPLARSGCLLLHAELRVTCWNRGTAIL